MIIEKPGENGLGVIGIADPGAEIQHAEPSEILPIQAGDIVFMGGNGGASLFRGKVLGLTFTPGQNTLVDSKRLRRVFSLVYIYNLTAPRIKWIDDKKLWDGAGRVNRKWLMNCTTAGTEKQQRKYQSDLKKTGRFEFTYLFDQGLVKGHVVVTDDTEYDLWLPCDVKDQVKYQGHYFTAKPVTADEGPYVPLDLQSLINLPVFTPEQLAAYMREANNLWINSLRENKLGRMFPPDDNLDYPPMEYLASGGHPMWFPSIVRALGNTWIRHLTAMSGAMRALVPGVVLYLISESAYRDNPCLVDGSCLIDMERASLVVSDMDWEHLTQILGGADSDDAVVCMRKGDRLIAWRRPNQPGEYFEFFDVRYTNMTQHDVPVHQPNVPEANIDWTKLPSRIDNRMTHYVEFSKPRQELPADWIARLKLCKLQMKANAGVLGQYVNLLMVWQAMGIEKKVLIRLENIIDATVKTGESLEQERVWINEHRDSLKEVPSHLSGRFPGVPTIQTQFDDVQDALSAEINHFRIRLAELEQECAPPQALIDAGTPFIEKGAVIRVAYANEIIYGVDASRDFVEEVLSVAKTPIPNLLIGAAVCGWTSFRHDPSCLWDAVCWTLGKKLEKGRDPGIADMFIHALRMIGLIAEPVVLDNGQLVWYQQPEPFEIVQDRVIRLNGVWFNAANAAACGYESMGAMPPQERKTWKDAVGRWVNGAVDSVIQFSREILFEKQGDRVVAKDIRTAHLVGYVDRGTAAQIEIGRQYYIIGGTANDGNVTARVRG